MPTLPGVIRLFQVSGITVFLHWSWLLAAVYEISARAGSYSRPGATLWSIAAGPLVNVALVPVFGSLTLLVCTRCGRTFTCCSDC